MARRTGGLYGRLPERLPERPVATLDRDLELRALVESVTRSLLELRALGGDDPLPPRVLAPLIVAATSAAPAALKTAQLEDTPENRERVAAYLAAGFRSMAVHLDPEHMAAWERTYAGGEDQ